MKSIGILGAGWLGKPLAFYLQNQGYQIKTSVTSTDKMKQLKTELQDVFCIAISEEALVGNVEDFLKDLEVLILAIPPKSQESLMQKKIKTLYTHLKNHPHLKIIFISSTSVFLDQHPFATYDEESLPNAETINGLDLIATENFIKTQQNPWVILRFGGLIGADRHPVKYLITKTNNQNPAAPVNLIQQTDCILLIEEIIKQEEFNQVFHGVNPHHVSRKEYYTQKAIELGLSIPLFLEETQQTGKIIRTDITVKRLNFQYQSEI